MWEVPLHTDDVRPRTTELSGTDIAPVHGTRPLWPSAGGRSTAPEVGSPPTARPRPLGSVEPASDGFPPGGLAGRRHGRKPTPAGGARAPSTRAACRPVADMMSVRPLHPREAMVWATMKPEGTPTGATPGSLTLTSHEEEVTRAWTAELKQAMTDCTAFTVVSRRGWTHRFGLRPLAPTRAGDGSVSYALTSALAPDGPGERHDRRAHGRRLRHLSRTSGIRQVRVDVRRGDEPAAREGAGRVRLLSRTAGASGPDAGRTPSRPCRRCRPRCRRRTAGTGPGRWGARGGITGDPRALR